MTQKLTKRFVESIIPVDDKELLLWDSEVKGFGVRVFSTGRRTYFVQYRNAAARTRRQKIGQHGVITADQAREEAKIILADVCKGSDPSALRKDKRAMPTFEKFVEEYLRVYAKGEKKEKTYNEEVKLLNTILIPKIGHELLDAISTRDLQKIHHEFKNRPYQANRIRSLLNKMFNMAMQWEITSKNPATAVQKYREEKRSRWLGDAEVQHLWVTLDSYRNQNIADIFRLLLLTGARKSEVLKATWNEFDLKKEVWTKPSHNTKQAKMEHLPLSSQAVELLKKMKLQASDSPFLFPGKVQGQPLKEIKKAWETIRQSANIADVRIHDLRHTYASHLVSSGLSLSIVGKLLGHTQASTTQRYAHLADEPLRKATAVFGDKLTMLTKAS
ncbi:MAG: tyrosine-type recombinase/integrase [Alphaproteobacteria bacterium]|nr:tyrosine-type recombinase/integrase [Alphaproteobacteria bacterium]NCQ67101.1 tyrosine-type recombinase/integrase [Alphaproteobacteria bacterium]NCT07698.1 tyrosine-type recombinase/integrase [Alphaproteobacteria bacterium]